MQTMSGVGGRDFQRKLINMFVLCVLRLTLPSQDPYRTIFFNDDVCRVGSSARGKPAVFTDPRLPGLRDISGFWSRSERCGGLPSDDARSPEQKRSKEQELEGKLESRFCRGAHRFDWFAVRHLRVPCPIKVSAR